MKKVLFGAIFGGLAMFLAGFASHVFLRLGDVGLSPLPAEDVVLATLSGNVGRSGLYFFPGMDPATATEDDIKAWEERYRRGPVGLLAFRAGGLEPMSPARLGKQFGGDIVAALFGAILLWLAGMASYTSRVVFVTLVGIAAWASIHLPLWNWYAFPADYTLAAGAHTALRWLAAGIVMGFVVRPGR